MQKRSQLTGLISFLVILLFNACSEVDQTLPSSRQIFIEIDEAQVTKNAKSGDEVPDYVAMYNGASDHAARTNGEANLISTFTAGDEVVWTLDKNENINLLSFEFFVLEGDDFFILPGGSYPEKQADGSWKGKVSPHAKEGSLLKYNIYFEIEGVGNFWWDPLAKVTSSTT